MGPNSEEAIRKRLGEFRSQLQSVFAFGALSRPIDIGEEEADWTFEDEYEMTRIAVDESASSGARVLLRRHPDAPASAFVEGSFPRATSASPRATAAAANQPGGGAGRKKFGELKNNGAATSLTVAAFASSPSSKANASPRKKKRTSSSADASRSRTVAVATTKKIKTGAATKAGAAAATKAGAATATNTNGTGRDVVCAALHRALAPHPRPVAADVVVCDAMFLAREISCVIERQCGVTERTATVRQLCADLQRNEALRARVHARSLSPAALVALDPEARAPAALRRHRVAARNAAFIGCYRRGDAADDAATAGPLALVAAEAEAALTQHPSSPVRGEQQWRGDCPRSADDDVEMVKQVPFDTQLREVCARVVCFVLFCFVRFWTTQHSGSRGFSSLDR